jgi:hypothetical protein
LEIVHKVVGEPEKARIRSKDSWKLRVYQSRPI